MTIFYFSGTGNSYAAARYIAGRLHANLAAIPAVMEAESITTEGHCAGVVFPSYLAFWSVFR